MHLFPPRLATALILAALATPALAEPVTILADIPVTASILRQVTGDLAEVETLLDAGADPHDFQLRPSQARALQSSDLLVWMGPPLTPWLDRAAARTGTDGQMQLLGTEGVQLHVFADPEDHPPEDGHGAQDGHRDDHDHGPVNPHGWLNPENGRLWFAQIADRLAALDPANDAAYRRNARDAQNRLDGTVAGLRSLFDKTEIAPFVTFHDAYGNFTQYFGLPDAIAVTIGDASTPSAARLSEVRERISVSGATCAFPETNQPARMIGTVIDGTGLRLGEELSPAGLNFPDGAGLYNEVLMQLGQRIAACHTEDS